MKINGKEAVEILEEMDERVSLHRKDNTDKFWSYKIKSGNKTEFAFDPKTKRDLNIRVDEIPPSIDGIINVQHIVGGNVSTALARVFSGGIHKASYKLKIQTKEALENFIAYYESK